MKKVLSILLLSVTILLSSCDKSGMVDNGKNYQVQPTWGEAFKYAGKAKPSQTTYTIIGVILILGGIVALVKLNKTPVNSPTGFIVGIFILFAAGLTSILLKPNAIRMDNVKTVPIEYFNEKGQTFILDSLFENNLMINAASK